MLKLSNWRESLLKYSVASILLSVPLFPKFPFIKIPGTFVAIRIEDFVISVSAVIWLIYIFPKLKLFIEGRVTRSIILFLSVGFVSYLSAVLITDTVDPFIGLLHWLRRVEYFIPLFLGFTVVRNDPKNINFYLKLLIIVTLLCFLYGLGQKFLNWPIIITQNQEYSKGIALRWAPGSHINATFAGHYDLATFLVLVLPIFAAALLLLKGVKTRMILLVTFFSGLWLLVNTASRISLASYLTAITLVMLFIRKYKAIPFIIVISLIFIFFSSNLQNRYQRLFDIVGNRLKSMVSVEITKPAYAQDADLLLQKKSKAAPTPTSPPVFEDRSTSIRLNVEWPRAIRAFTKNPLIGTGYSSITLATDNDFLRLLGEIGLFGFLAFLLIFLEISLFFYNQFPFVKNYEGVELAMVAGLSGAFPGLVLNAMFIDIFEASKFATIFWLITGMCLAVILSKRNEQYI